jgi:hypothetical protein
MDIPSSINGMTTKDKILSDLKGISDPVILNLILEFMQIIIPNSSKTSGGNSNTVLAFAGTLDNESALEINRTINEEFNNIEGEW